MYFFSQSKETFIDKLQKIKGPFEHIKFTALKDLCGAALKNQESNTAVVVKVCPAGQFCFPMRLWVAHHFLARIHSMCSLWVSVDNKVVSHPTDEFKWICFHGHWRIYNIQRWSSTNQVHTHEILTLKWSGNSRCWPCWN